MKDKYTRAEQITANSTNVTYPHGHDAILIVNNVSSGTPFESAGGGWTAEIITYAHGTIMNHKGSPRVQGPSVSTSNPEFIAATGDTITFYGRTGDTHLIIPIQAKSVGALVNCNVFGLR